MEGQVPTGPLYATCLSGAYIMCSIITSLFCCHDITFLYNPATSTLKYEKVIFNKLLYKILSIWEPPSTNLEALESLKVKYYPVSWIYEILKSVLMPFGHAWAPLLIKVLKLQISVLIWCVFHFRIINWVCIATYYYWYRKYNKSFEGQIFNRPTKINWWTCSKNMFLQQFVLSAW